MQAVPKKSNWEVIEHYNTKGGLTGVPSSQTKVNPVDGVTKGGLTGVPSSQTKVNPVDGVTKVNPVDGATNPHSLQRKFLLIGTQNFIQSIFIMK